MTSFDILSAVQTRSGLTVLKDKWINSIQSNPWMDSSHVQSSLWETDSVVFPLFALKYNWNGKGCTNFHNLSLTICLQNFTHPPTSNTPLLSITTKLKEL